MKDLGDFLLVVERLQYPGFTFKLETRAADVFLSVVCINGTNNETGVAEVWTGRKWLLQSHMTNSEVVQTAFKAVMTALEHEAREQFKYRGVAVLHGHYDLEQMVSLSQNGALLTDRRPEQMTT